MKIQFIGATHEVTGSCTLLEVNGRYFLVDCGMEQGQDVFQISHCLLRPPILRRFWLPMHILTIPVCFPDFIKRASTVRFTLPMLPAICAT